MCVCVCVCVCVYVLSGEFCHVFVQGGKKKTLERVEVPVYPPGPRHQSCLAQRHDSIYAAKVWD